MKIIRFLPIIVSLFVSLSLPAYAQGNWKQQHPRRAEVNERIKKQDQRINQEKRLGKISPEKAAQLKNQELQIRQEEWLMAGQQHKKALTIEEQETLNQQENKLRREMAR